MIVMMMNMKLEVMVLLTLRRVQAYQQLSNLSWLHSLVLIQSDGQLTIFMRRFVKKKKRMPVYARMQSEGAVSTAAPRLPEKVVTVYTEIGGMLKHYSSGKLPKAFKIIQVSRIGRKFCG